MDVTKFPATSRRISHEDAYDTATMSAEEEETETMNMEEYNQ